MATGYTAIVTEKPDLTLGEFVWRCARGFGAFVDQREDGLDAKPRMEEKPSDWNAKRLAEARRELDRLNRITPKEAEAAAVAAYEAEVSARAKRAESIAAKNAAYMRMRDLVSAWEPPTAHHMGLRRFMLEQIDESLRFDCGGWEQAEPKRLTAQEWLDGAVDRAFKDIEYHAAGDAKERARVRGSNQWKRALAKCLPLSRKPKARRA